MSFSKFSISTVAQLVMKDLSCFYNKTEYLSDNIRTDIESWIEWAVDPEITNEEKEEIMNEIHEGLQYMNIWHYEQHERIDNLNEIKSYFITKYPDKEYIRKFERMVVDYYIEELKSN